MLAGGLFRPGWRPGDPQAGGEPQDVGLPVAQALEELPEWFLLAAGNLADFSEWEIARAGQHPKVVLEATYGWYWAADTLAAAGAEVHLAHPLGVKAFTYRRVKNDERDSADLADLLRMGRLPEAWIAPAEVRELRELTRYRQKLVHLRTSCKDQVHGVLAKLGVPVACTDIFGVAGSAWLDTLGLPQPYAGKVTSLRHLAGELTTEIPCCPR